MNKQSNVESNPKVTESVDVQRRKLEKENDMCEMKLALMNIRTS